MDITLGPASLTREISPPPTRRPHQTNTTAFGDSAADGGAGCGNPPYGSSVQHIDARPTMAAVEAGHVQISDHLKYFSKHLMRMKRASPQPTMTVEDFETLFQRNQHPLGHHFVIHQHDHPISGIVT